MVCKGMIQVLAAEGLGDFGGLLGLGRTQDTGRDPACCSDPPAAGIEVPSSSTTRHPVYFEYFRLGAAACTRVDLSTCEA